MRKLSESIWNDIRKQSSGAKERIEDDINILDCKDFSDWLTEHYISNEICYVNLNTEKYTYMSILLDVEIYREYFPENAITICNEIEKNHEDIYIGLCNEFNIGTYDESLLKIEPNDDREIDNKFFVEIVDYLIDKYSDIIEVHHNL